MPALNRQLAATLDGVDLLAEWVKPRALAGVGKQAQLILTAARCNRGADQLGLLWCPERDARSHRM
jgi:hypothetical protein